MTRLLILLILLIALPTMSWSADFEKGLEAYETGDYETTLKEFRAVADQGEVAAQNSLGLMYYKGQDVPENYIQAYMWASLAAAQSDEDAVEGLEILEKKMTPVQVAEAQRLAREWTPKGT